MNVFWLKLKLTLLGAVVTGLTYILTYWWLPDLIHLGVCTHVIGPC